MQNTPYFHRNKTNTMRKIKLIAASIVLLTTIAAVYAFRTNNTVSPIKQNGWLKELAETQTVNLFVTHGHCSLPFGGIVNDLKVITTTRKDQGNPLEDMKVSFQIDPKSFNACGGDDLTATIQTPGLFSSKNDEKIVFTSTNVYTMGVDWYQINGKMTIKGVEKEVKFFATGIRNPKETMPSFLVLEGQLDLSDWGIDYEKIVNGVSSEEPTKWMHLNMKIEMKKEGC